MTFCQSRLKFTVFLGFRCCVKSHQSQKYTRSFKEYQEKDVTILRNDAIIVGVNITLSLRFHKYTTESKAILDIKENPNLSPARETQTIDPDRKLILPQQFDNVTKRRVRQDPPSRTYTLRRFDETADASRSAAVDATLCASR